MIETLILVDSTDTPLGTEEKLEAHLKGLRHRAFSVMIYNTEGKLLIQKRADNKYHSAGLWANSCCGHPRPGETLINAAQRRLHEELGFSCPLRPLTQVCYTLSMENGLQENEYTHIFEGVYENSFTPNPEEVSQVAWATPQKILLDALAHKSLYTRWFRLYLFKYFNSVFPSEKMVINR